jgi:hypothetical protein
VLNIKNKVMSGQKQFEVEQSEYDFGGDDELMEVIEQVSKDYDIENVVEAESNQPMKITGYNLFLREKFREVSKDSDIVNVVEEVSEEESKEDSEEESDEESEEESDDESEEENNEPIKMTADNLFMKKKLRELGMRGAIDLWRNLSDVEKQTWIELTKSYNRLVENLIKKHIFSQYYQLKIFYENN